MSHDQSPERPVPPRSVVIFGPSGCGKTTIGKRVATRLGARFVDADDYHSDSAVEKMRCGRGLSDHDREPWLRRLAELLHGAESGPNISLVLACSALKKKYRDILAGQAVDSSGVSSPNVTFVYLSVPRQELARRLALRPSHFAGPSLLDSQLEALELPREGIVDGTAPADEIVDQVCSMVTNDPYA